MSKFILTETSKEVDGVTVYQIQATKDIPVYGVKNGDFGGWLSAEFQLSHDGDCWIEVEGVLIGATSILDNALITGKVVDSTIFGSAVVKGTVINSRVRDNVVVLGSVIGIPFISLSDNVLVNVNGVMQGEITATDNVVVNGIVNGKLTLTDNVVLGKKVFIEAPDTIDIQIGGNVEFSNDSDLVITATEN